LRRKILLKITDIVIIILAFGLTVFSAFASYLKPEKTIYVQIEGSGQQWIFPLDAEENISVNGPLGNTVVRIHENQAWVDSSPCNNQTCVTMGRVRSNGDWVACLPNNVFLIIKGSDDIRKTTDAATW
jgi:hypothetical protein